MIIHNPIVSGSLRFPSDDSTNLVTMKVVNGTLETVTLNSSGVDQNVQPSVNYSGSFTGSFVGDGSSLTGIAASSFNLDALDALGSATVAQGDNFLFSDDGTEKKITFSNLEDSIFGNVSGNVTIAAGGAATIANSFKNDSLNSFTASLSHSDVDFKGSSIVSGAAQINSLINDTIAATIVAEIDNDEIPIAKLASDSITIGGTSVTLGGTLSNSDLLEEVVGGTGIQSGSGDIAGVTAGDGLTGGGNSGTVSLAVNVDDSSLEINSDTVRVKAGGITNAMLDGSITNAKLADSSISISGTSVSLGGSITDETLFGGTGVVTGSAQVNANSITNFDTNVKAKLDADTVISGSSQVTNIANSQLAGSIANSKLSNSAVTISGTSVSLGGSISDETLFGGTGVVTGSAQVTNIANSQLAGSIANAKLANSAITISGTSVSLGGSINDQTLFGGTGVVSGSSQVSLETLTGGSGIQSGSITNADLAGSIANSKLSNSSISIGGISFSLGDTDATPAFDLSDSTGYATSNLSGTITNSQLAGSIAASKLAGSIGNSKLSNSAITISGTSVSLGGSITDETLFGGVGVVSGSGQISHDSTTGFVSNEHIDHSSVSITAGTGLNGGGDLTSTRTLNVDNDYLNTSLNTFTSSFSTFGLSLVDDSNASTARTTLGVDAAGTDNSTNVTLDDSSHNYLSLSGQEITIGEVDISDDTNLAVSDTTNVDMILSGDTLSANLKGGVVSGSAQIADVTLTTAAQTNITSLGTLTTLTVDDITLNGSTISDSGDLTLDIGGDLNIDVDGTDIVLKDGGTAFGRFKRDSSDFIIKSEANNEDIIFRGQDGGSTIDALLLDMSSAGEATFNSVVNATKVNTGQGDNELYAMNQDVQTSNNVQFANLTLSGDLTVNGETSFISSSVLQIGDNIIELNGSAAANGGIYVRDAVGTTNSGSLLWDTSNDFWKAGAKDSENEILTVGNVDSDIKTFSLPANTTISTFGKSLIDDSNASTARSTLGVDAAGTDNSTDVTLAGNSFLSLSGQEITAETIDISSHTNLAVSDTSEVNMILSGDTISAELIGGVVSGSSQISGITNSQLAGSIANSKLSNSSISIGGISFSLGDTDATPAFDLSDATGYATSNLSGTITNSQLAGSIANGKLSNSAITISGTSVSLGGSISDQTLFGGTGVVSGSSQIDVTSTTNYVAPAIKDNSGTPALVSGITAAEVRSTIGVDAAGTDNSTDVTLSGTPDYITISGQTITRNQIDLANDVTGVLPSANLDSDTAHLSGTQTFSGAKTFSAAVTVSNSTASTSKTTGALKVTGGIGLSGALNAGGDVVAFASSDERYKDNIIPIQNPNEKIKQIGGYTFDWNDKHEIFKGNHDIGVIAQEIEKVLPEIVETRENGFKAVKYEKIVALLIESNKELIKRIEELENKIS